MSGYGTNKIFLNKKVRIGRPEHLLPFTLYIQQHLTFALPDQPILLKMHVIYVSSLTAVSISGKEKLANETVNYDTKNKAYVLN